MTARWMNDYGKLRMMDQTGNLWNAWETGESASNIGESLTVVDGYITEWYEWVEKFPDTELAGHQPQNTE